MQAIVAEVLAFQMPGNGIPGFMRKAAAMAKAGIYDLRVHRDEVLLPILQHWKIFEFSPSLSPEQANMGAAHLKAIWGPQ